MKDKVITKKLKVYYGFYEKSKKKHPFIRLKGFYLARSGFKIGDEINVTIDANQIVITKVKNKPINIKRNELGWPTLTSIDDNYD